MLDRRRLLQALLALAFPAPLFAQERANVLESARKEGSVALATSVSAAGFPRFLQAFMAKYPGIDATRGLYSAPTGRVLARVDAEVQARSLTFDVLHVASLAPYLAMARKGQLLAYRSPELAAYPPEAATDQWAIARIVGVIMAYNKNVLAPEKAPKAWVDLLRPEFKGRKLIIQDSAAGTAFNQMYLLEKRLGADFMRKWGAQEPVIVATSAQLIDMLVRGEALLGATVDHFRAFEVDAVKAGIVGVYPSEGMPLAVAPAAIFKNAPHPNAARLFVDYMLSEEGQNLIAIDIFGAYSMRKGVRTPAGQLPLAETKPLLPTDLADYEKAAQNFPETFEKYFKA
ncbi:MAG TPA: extracellular solute-binding protein [Casimicrobiaceae bacterium]|jgi:iron(III) transport system substrate-binding protein|nr:extracellular solute-binding protein [Casimicrobiaceae bacterium]